MYSNRKLYRVHSNAFGVLGSFLFFILFFLSMCCGNALLAQSTAKGYKAIIVVGKPMTAIDSSKVTELFYLALREKTIENLNKSAEYFERIIQIDPENDAALYELGTLKKMANNLTESQDLLERAVTVNRNNEWYWLALANCYEKNNEFVKLEYVFNELIRINPSKPEYFYDKANACFFEGKLDEALDVYNQLEQMVGPNDELLANRQKIYLKQGKLDLAAKQLEEMISAHPKEVKYYLFLSELYTSSNLTEKAFKILIAAEKINSGNGLVHLALADIYRDKKNQESSFNELTLAFANPEIEVDQKIRIILGYIPRFPDASAKASALELSKILVSVHPDDARAYATYADMLMQNDRIKEAKEMYKKSYALNNQVYEVQEQLVRIELGQNSLDEAIADGESSLSLFPNQAWMNYLVGIAWYQKRDFEKAVGYLKNATSIGLDDKDLLSQGYSALGDCFHNLNDIKNSDISYEKALIINPDNVFTLNNYAYYLSLRSNQLDKAAQMSKHSIDLQPNNASFEDTYAWILFKQKDYSGAKFWIEKALADDKTNSAVKTEHYGDIMFYLGDVDAAVENWKKAKATGIKSLVLDRKINERKYVE